jgi:hypothetical protein
LSLVGKILVVLKVNGALGAIFRSSNPLFPVRLYEGRICIGFVANSFPSACFLAFSPRVAHRVSDLDILEKCHGQHFCIDHQAGRTSLDS